MKHAELTAVIVDDGSRAGTFTVDADANLAPAHAETVAPMVPQIEIEGAAVTGTHARGYFLEPVRAARRW